MHFLFYKFHLHIFSVWWPMLQRMWSIKKKILHISLFTNLFCQKYRYNQAFTTNEHHADKWFRSCLKFCVADRFVSSKIKRPSAQFNRKNCFVTTAVTNAKPSLQREIKTFVARAATRFFCCWTKTIFAIITASTAHRGSKRKGNLQANGLLILRMNR